jgi:hypothetical protein
MRDRDDTTIERKDMTKFGRPAQDLVLHLVNTEGIRWRVADHNHLLLYPPDGVGRPFKISASRPAEATVRFLRGQFMGVYDIKDEDGNVPGKEAEVVAEVESEVVTAKEAGDAAEAVRTLAAALGVSLGGTVSEEDYLVVVAEKDACAAEAEQLRVDLVDLGQQNDLLQSTNEDLTAQRDQLLGEHEDMCDRIDRARKTLEG